MKVQEIYKQWLDNPYFDEAFRNELASIDQDPKEIEDRFYKELEFGTAGMRGIIGAGRNRMNAYVVRKASQGFANFLLERSETVSRDKSVVIAYDSRHMSPEFGMETAKVMAGNGIKAYVFTGVRTTPELSFAVRHLGCMGGVMITASHNPPEYNGYKVYDETGCQLVPHLADALVAHVEGVTDFEMVRVLSEEEGKAEGLILPIDSEVDDPYVKMVKAVSMRPTLLAESEIKAVFTPLHGTGGETVTRVLTEMGFKHLIQVPEQVEPDANFPTCKEPNPESESAFELALVHASKHDADLVIAVDPDCDRIGFMVKANGGYQMVNGNQIGTLFMEYVLSSKEGLTKDHYVVNTVVSSDLARAQAAHFGVSLRQTLTGFKFIGEQIEKDPDTFVMGYEESFGYLFAPHVRDKDAVMGTLLAIEMAEYYKRQGLSLADVLAHVYTRHGYFVEETLSKRFEGKEGQANMMAIMNKFRSQAEDLITYTKKIDYLNDATGLPKADVLKFYLDDHSWMVLRPSGTEPKLKVYFSIQGENRQASLNRLEGYKKAIVEKVLR